MPTTAYASNGDRDGLKTGMYWAISSQATQEWAEGSTTRPYHPERMKRVHECGGRLPVSVSGCKLGFSTLGILTMADKKFFVDAEELRAAYDDLGTAEEVAFKYGVSKKLVLTYLRRFGIATHPRHMLTDAVRAEIVALAEAGRTVPEIVATVGFSNTAVRKHLTSVGVKAVDPAHPGVVTTWAGYRKRLCVGHPRADSKGYVNEHVLTVESHLGRTLNRDEVVHHKDGCKGNNALSNLELMLDSDHRRLHALQGDCGWQMYHNAGKR